MKDIENQQWRYTTVGHLLFATRPWH